MHSVHEVLKVGFVDDDFAVVHVLQDVVEGDMTALFFEGLILLLVTEQRPLWRNTFVMF